MLSGNQNTVELYHSFTEKRARDILANLQISNSVISHYKFYYQASTEYKQTRHLIFTAFIKLTSLKTQTDNT
jgi:hypothetical protein